jgi:hypothetical protein
LSKDKQIHIIPSLAFSAAFVAGWISQEATSDTETNVRLCRVLLGNGGDKTKSNLSQEKN